MKRIWVLLLICAALPARAHQLSVSIAELDVRGERITGRLRFAAADLGAVIHLERSPDGSYTQSGIDAVLAALVDLTLGDYRIATPDGPCHLDRGSRAELEGGDGVVVSGMWSCPKPVEALRARVGFLEVFAMGHVHLAKISFAGEQVSQRVVEADSPTFDVERRIGFWVAARRFLQLGIEHIFTGYDHIAFLLGLLLLGGTFRELVKVVTAFTAAHSITLALATLDVVRLPPRVVEPLIAASIVYVALENLWALRSPAARSQAVRHRWVLTFAFGLVHGFGFAGVLAALHLPRSGIAAALVTFNVGVEVGQICIVALALPLLLKLRRARGFDPGGVRAASACVGALGFFWLVQRLMP
jgi:hydrogenase/urease accessory protein HupE